MKIGVIADTHIPLSAKKLPQKVYDYFKSCDLIIHAGDIVEMSVIDELNSLAQTKVVHGNMDSSEVKDQFPEKTILDVAGKRIGVIHGAGPSFKILETVSKAFDKKCDIIVFGHSHMPFNEKKNGTLFFNPGSPTDRVFAHSRSFGIIEINGDTISAQIIKVDD